MARVAAQDVGAPGFRRIVDDVESLADREMHAAAGIGRRLAGVTGGGLAAADDGERSVTRNLAELRRWAADLVPPSDLEVGPRRRVMGLIPRRDPARAYEDRWSDAQAPLAAAVAVLGEAVAALRADNARLDQESVALATGIATLTEYAGLTERLDLLLEAYAGALPGSEATRAEAIRSELLFAVRRRRQEILTQLAVAQQGHAALEIIQEHNRDLIAAVNNATLTTVAAVQTAAAAIQAVQARRRLDQRLEATAAAGPPGSEVDAIRRAWDGVAVTLNEAETLRRQVLESAARLSQFANTP
ncbi:MAG: hypothetical protein QOK05_2606 [Chloroflexota bacterium]|jgi:uncharacterized protein YaaN involved in tellurite resistance|nr:hypothetical protein [Chloroflexota bacterium]